ncbi:unnamed protein product [Periconia digitata]|uniref:N-acetyltransferase domain-containing protein n=1 Tax=Periconia digitata TaxID=1303443 RepID=A0A9W4UG88_9PLEO|nr:unnamed protein product [Periconia digitata]
MLFQPQYIPRILRKPVLRLLVVFLFVLDACHICDIHSHHVAARQSPPARNSKRIYIAANHWNDAPLLREYWNNALIALVKELGVDNVYVNIYESGSFDETKDALRELDNALGELQVARDISLSYDSHEHLITQQPGEGWIEIPGGEMALRRIPFLARQRNQLVHSLRAAAERGLHFDTVLFLNDVIFTPEDVLTLLDTNSGNYSAACSLDYAKFPQFYDTFALRDSEGHQIVMQTWPYFRSAASRYAAQRMQPVPVSSCWNGMVAMPTAPFLAENPLLFRGISDSLGSYHLEASECCLIHADNYWTSRKGVFLNPSVKVGYSSEAFEAIRRSSSSMSIIDVYKGVWANRILRWTSSLKTAYEEHVVRERVTAWKEKHQGESEPGISCLINEMQVIHAKGWRHLKCKVSPRQKCLRKSCLLSTPLTSYLTTLHHHNYKQRASIVHRSPIAPKIIYHNYITRADKPNTTMSTIRPMRASDLLRMSTTNLDHLTETYNIGFYQEYLTKWPDLCRIIEGVDGEIEGYILGKLESSPYPSPTNPYTPSTCPDPNYLPWHGHITALTVSPTARRLGHATSLSTSLEQASDAADAWFVDLFVRESNAVAKELYRKMGYSVYRKVVAYYNDGEDALDMRKSLSRDKDKECVREGGEAVEVRPEDVW